MRDAAQRALRFVEKRNGEALRIAGYDGLQVLVGSEDACKLAIEYWRYTGEIVSSRQALDVLDGDGLWKYDASELLRRLEEYGGLFSFTLKNDKKAAKFYNLLEVSKGPSMGAEFTLVSPYTLLAHYDELEWAEGCGVSKNLIRVSVGIEPQRILQKHFSTALDSI